MATGMLVTEAFQQVCTWLEQARLKPGDRLPSERALSRATGLGHYAVNRAMSRCIAEGRVERQGYKLFLANRETQRAAKRFHFALVISRRSEHLASFRRCAQTLDIQLDVHTWEAAEEIHPLLLSLEREPVEGIIFDPPSGPVHTAWEQAALRLHRRSHPVVCMSWGSNELPSISSHPTYGLELAVSHLTELGHLELGLINPPHPFPLSNEIIDSWNSLCRRSNLHSSVERIRFETSWLVNQGEAEQLADLLVGPWRDVTGLIIRIGYTCALPALLSALARRGRRVPESLSIFAIGNARELLTAQPRVTSASTDIALWQEMAIDLLQRETRKRRLLGVTPSPAILQVMPRLHLRESTSPHGEVAPLHHPRTTDGETPPLRGHGQVTEELGEKLRRPYSIAAKAFLSEKPRFQSLDLLPYANRPLNFRRGWLGDLPLRCLPPGPREIHGVPFQIIGGPARHDLGAVVFQSAVNTTGNSRRLPERILIPLGLHAEAIYFLHGCGFAKINQPFARYIFHRNKGKSDEVALVSLGQSQEEEPGIANIQDWWSDFPHYDFPHARMAPLPDHDEGKPANRHVFPYTLEWINPTPSKLIDHIEIVVDPTVPTTLGLLAVTVVKPSDIRTRNC